MSGSLLDNLAHNSSELSWATNSANSALGNMGNMVKNTARLVGTVGGFTGTVDQEKYTDLGRGTAAHVYSVNEDKALAAATGQPNPYQPQYSQVVQTSQNTYVSSLAPVGGNYGRQPSGPSTDPRMDHLMDTVVRATQSPTEDNKQAALEAMKQFQTTNGHYVLPDGAKYDVSVNGKEFRGSASRADNYDTPEIAVRMLSQHIAGQVGKPALRENDLGVIPVVNPPAPAVPSVQTSAPVVSGIATPLPPQDTQAQPAPATVPVESRPVPAQPHPAHPAKVAEAHEAPAPVEKPVPAHVAKAEPVWAHHTQTQMNQDAQLMLQNLQHNTGDKNQKAFHTATDASGLDGVVGPKTKEALRLEGIDPSKPITAETLETLKHAVEAQQAKLKAGVETQNPARDQRMNEALNHYEAAHPGSATHAPTQAAATIAPAATVVAPAAPTAKPVVYDPTFGSPTADTSNLINEFKVAAQQAPAVATLAAVTRGNTSPFFGAMQSGFGGSEVTSSAIATQATGLEHARAAVANIAVASAGNDDHFTPSATPKNVTASKGAALA